MRTSVDPESFAPLTTKENSRMSRRLALAATVCAAALYLLALSSTPASAAPSVWWQILNGSRPTNLWTPQNEVQEINAPSTPFTLSVGGTFVGGFNLPPAFPEATAANVQAALEGAYGAGNVQVTGGPGGTAPLLVTSVGAAAGRSVAPVQSEFGATTRIVTSGGSGRLTVTLTDLGDAPVNGAGTPVTITDELPEGVIATGVEAFAGQENLSGPVGCEVKTSKLVVCSFEGTLPAYEAIEVEVLASLTGAPPAAGAPGKVTVSGGNAPTASAAQAIEVGAEEASFGIERFSAQAEEEGGEPAIQAGGHPFQLTTTLQLNSGPVGLGATRREWTVKQPAMPRNLRFPLPAGLVGNVSAIPQCSMTAFFNDKRSEQGPICPSESAIGVAGVTFIEKAAFGLVRVPVPVFNLPPAPGEPVRFGFSVVGDPIIIDTAVDPNDHYRIVASVNNTTQLVEFLGSTLTIWGVPGAHSHDPSRGWACLDRFGSVGPCERPNDLSEEALLRAPVVCNGPLDYDMEGEPWNAPIGEQISESSFSGAALDGCNRVPFNPAIDIAPTSKLAANPSGLEVRLDMPNVGLFSPAAIAESQPKKLEVVLPEGVTTNPSVAEGLVGCSPAQFAQESAASAPGAGCPDASKIGEVQFTTPLLAEEGRGSLYIATPHDNPTHSLLGLYLVARIPDRGIVIKLTGKVEPNPSTGQLTTTFDDQPQLPFSTFKLHFREGARAALVTPPACGNYESLARFMPWSAANPDDPSSGEVVTRTTAFAIEHGVDGGACPPAGVPPFAPGLEAGSTNNAAGQFSPFDLRISRTDGEQELTGFSIKLPSGVLGKLTGVPFCSDAAIAQAKSRTGENGGQEELDSPSCPAASEIGHIVVGAGVGPSLTYAHGKLYLAGPYHGSALSVVAVTAAKVGPFDLGTVVVREALRIDPVTGVAFIDAAGSDPIPHIIQGIPIHVRLVDVYVDRPGFMLNPTSCDPTSVASTVSGSGADFASANDDSSVTVSTRFQAADCASLRFKPRFEVSTSGRTSRLRGASLHVKIAYPAGSFGTQANIKMVHVELPKQLPSRLATLQRACPDTVFDRNPAECGTASRVGQAKAVTPILPVPLEGPAYFVSHGGEQFPELVLVLQGYGITLQLKGETFISKAGVTSSTFKQAPDAPISSFELTLPQATNSALAANTDLCAANLTMPTTIEAQNGDVIRQSTHVEAQGCPYRLRVLRHSTHGQTLRLKVSVPTAGRLVASGSGVTRAARSTSGPQTVTVQLVERHDGRLRSRIALRFTPSNGKQRRILSRSVTAVFR